MRVLVIEAVSGKARADRLRKIDNTHYRLKSDAGVISAKTWEPLSTSARTRRQSGINRLLDKASKAKRIFRKHVHKTNPEDWRGK